MACASSFTQLSSAAVFPDFGAVDDAYGLGDAVGALLTVTLVVSVLMLVISAAGWAIAHSTGNYRALTRARTGLGVALAAALLAGAGVAWGEFLLDLGTSL